MGTDQPPQDVDAYLAGRPAAVRTRLEALRRIIRETVPEAEEGFAYGMPAYRYQAKPLAYFAGHAAHVGLYALPATHEAFAAELSDYRTGKGSVRFPLDRPVPEALVGRMVAHRKAAIDKGGGGGRAGRLRKTTP